MNVYIYIYIYYIYIFLNMVHRSCSLLLIFVGLKNIRRKVPRSGWINNSYGTIIKKSYKEPNT